MRYKNEVHKRYFRLGLIILVISLPFMISSFVFAAPTSSSDNYGIDEYFMGAGGLNDANSASYRARASLGDTAVGNSSSTNYQANSGFTTDADPYLEFVVDNSVVNLGTQSIASASTATATFTIRTYLASGYIVRTESAPPKNDSYTMTNLTTPTASNPGTEQFGINLVANTAPVTIGANPVQIPDDTYSFGQAATGYDTPNLYKYVQGDAVAISSKSSGTTQFTVTYLMNVKTTSPGGIYVMPHVLVATSTF